MEKKVIQLPKVHTWRKTWQNRFHERKASVALSIAAVLVLSVSLNEWLGSFDASSSEQNQQRKIAMANLTQEDYRKQIQWEHELAEKVAEARSAVAHLSERPSLKDQLLFGHLGGRYGIKFENGKVAGFEFDATKGSNVPVKISDYEKFIEEYRGLWTVDFAEARLLEKSSNKVIYDLINSENGVAAKAELDLDQAGQVISMKIIK